MPAKSKTQSKCTCAKRRRAPRRKSTASRGKCDYKAVSKAMHEFKRGKLYYGKTSYNPKGYKVKSRQQAIAIGCSN